MGDNQVRHRGTLGGSVVHGDPASDLPAALLALDATFVARGPRGERTIAASDFFLGFLETALATDELLTEIRVPKSGATGFAYEKFNRRAQDWAIVGAVAARMNGDTHVALVNMGSTPMRARRRRGRARAGCEPDRRGRARGRRDRADARTSTPHPSTASTSRGCSSAAPSKLFEPNPAPLGLARVQTVSGSSCSRRGEACGSAGTCRSRCCAFRGVPLLHHTLAAATSSAVGPVAVVVSDDRVAAAVPAGVEVLRNDAPEAGIASSLQVALRAVTRRADVVAVVVGLADQPLVGAEAYRRVGAAAANGAALAVATYAGRRANPVLVGREHWAEALTLTGDEGARVLLRRYGPTEVPCDGTGSPTDIDTPEDLAALEAGWKSATTSE